MRLKLVDLAAGLWLCLAPAAGAADIAIGIANPFSGRYVASGARNLLAVMMAVERVNADGGVLGEPLRLVTADDECGMQAAAEAAEELVRAGVVMVVGHMCSHSSLIAAAIYDIADIVMITPSSTHPRVTQENRPNVFRLVGRDDQQAEEAAEKIASRWPKRRLAIVHDGSIYGQGLALATRRALQRRRQPITRFAAYVPGLADYSSLIESLRGEGIDLLYIAGYGPDAGRIARAVAAAGLDWQLIGGDGLGMDEFAVAAGPAAEGAIFSSFRPDLDSIDRTALDPADLEVLEAFAAGGTSAYAAVEVWAQAAARAGTLDYKTVVEMLRRGHYETIRGPVAFDRQGDLIDAHWTWRVWHDGKADPLP